MNIDHKANAQRLLEQIVADTCERLNPEDRTVSAFFGSNPNAGASIIYNFFASEKYKHSGKDWNALYSLIREVESQTKQ